MFRGGNALSLDVKGRMAMPTRYRDALAERCAGQLVITVNPDDRCLFLYPLPEWEEIECKLNRLPSFNKRVKRLQRLLIGHATECALDSHGRVLLPPLLREYAGIDRRILLLGQLNKFEIWDEPTWNASRDQWLQEDEADAGEMPPELESLSL